MNIMGFLKKERNTSVSVILAADKIQEVLNNFAENELLEADGIILIWQARGQYYIDTGGFDEERAYWATTKARRLIDEKGLPRK